MKKPELLLPAGDFARMQAAYDFGADAVYAGLPRYSLRARNNGFVNLAALEKGITAAHARGKKFFLATNILPHNAKLKTFIQDLAPIMALRPDALIMADPGLIMRVKETWPDIPLHLSVQANTTNYWGVEFWQKLGITRIILSRELSLGEIAEIRAHCPDIELEVFVHGALCIAYSGRCLLSGYFNHRDPNQGTCTNSCRWNYNLHDTVPTVTGDVATEVINFDFTKAAAAPPPAGGREVRHPLADKIYLMEEANRPGSLLPVMEDEHGTYIMNSKDLRAVENVAELIKIGVDSLKIEGRTKSLYYVARTAQVYRQAIDDAAAGKSFDYRLLSQLESLANRGYTSGFLERHPSQDYQNYLVGHSVAKQSIYVGVVTAVDAGGWARVEVKNKFAVGDQLEIIHPSGNEIITLRTIKLNGEEINEARGVGIEVMIPGLAGKEQALLARVFGQEAGAA